MKKIKLILLLGNKKTFFDALGFYLFHLVFSFIVSIVLSLVFLGFLFENLFSDNNMLFLSRILPTVYLILLSILLIKNKGRKIKYLNLVLVGIIVTYLINPMLGFIFPAYITTLGEGNKESETTLL